MGILEVIYQLCLNTIKADFEYVRKTEFKSKYVIGDVVVWVSAVNVDGEYEFMVKTSRLTLKVYQATAVTSAIIMAFNSHKLNRPTEYELKQEALEN